MKQLFLLIFLLISSLGYAQRMISGQITDEKNKAIAGVTISVKNTAITTVSDEEGKYTIAVPDEYNSLEFRMNGFIVQVLEINKDVVNLTMTPLDKKDSFDLSFEELINAEIITAGKKEEKIADIPASILILKRKDIELYGFSDLQEIFAHIAGLYFVDNKSFLGPTIGVRGYMTANPTNVLVMINGIVQQNDLHNSFSFHQCPIPVEAIDRIEVVRGPMSVVYGSNAFFGAINIITNESVADGETFSNISITKGNYGKTKAMISSKGKMSFLEYAFSFSYHKDDGIDEPFSKMVSDFDNKYADWGLLDIGASSKGYFTSDQKYIQFSGKFKDLYLETGFAASKYGQTFSTLFYLPAQCKSYFSKSAIGFNHKFSNKLSINTRITYSRYDLLMEDNYYTEDTTGFGHENDIYSFGQYWSEKVEAELNLFYSPIPNLNLSLNSNYSAILDVGDKTDAPYSSAVNLLNRSGGLVEGDRINISAFYSQIDYIFFNRLKLILGGRIEKMGPFDLVLYRAMYYPLNEKFTGKFTGNNFHFDPRAAIILGLSKKHILKFMYGEAHKLPAVWELRNNLTVGHSLDPEKIKTYEFNYLGSYSKYFTLNISFFSNSIEDVVLRSIIFNGTNYSSYFTNGAKIATNGIECSLTTMPSTNFKAEISIVYQESKYKSQGLNNIDVEFSPNLLAYIKTSYQFNEKLSVSLLGNYVDKMYAQWDNTPIDPADPNSPPKGRYGNEVDAYFLLVANVRFENILLGKSQNKNSLYFNLKCNNLLDTEIHYPSTSVSTWADKGVLGYGFSMLLSAGYKF
jgi:outer membrane receptor protein involved in Fe transport